MITIRQMYRDDIDIVRQVDAQAFGEWLQQIKGGPAKLPERTRTNVLALLEKDPNGCFVAEDGSRVVGLVFSRTWGSVGWLGPFVVLPDYQGGGIGKLLIDSSLGYLRKVGVRVIGLETMPESPYNLGLYLKLGFAIRSLTLTLSGAVGQGVTRDNSVSRWSLTDIGKRERWLLDLREAADLICPGLDYSKEIQSTARHGLGETLVLTHDHKALGFAVVWTANPREGMVGDTASIRLLALNPDTMDTARFRELLRSVEALSLTQHKQRFTIPINTRYAWALKQLLGWGYRVERAMVRMTLESMGCDPSAGDLVNCSRWAG